MNVIVDGTYPGQREVEANWQRKRWEMRLQDTQEEYYNYPCLETYTRWIDTYKKYLKQTSDKL